ncbi:MAG: histidine phosphatase family protein, partial [Actinomycetota bacterium]|nr:histidine phosphatase family protein [Actinomycetota bacterium]
LNDVGRYQVQHAAEILAGMTPTAIISSDLGRARETAQALANLVGLSVTTYQALRETNGGLWEGKTGAENRVEDFQNFIRWIDGDDNPAGTTGEKRSEVAARAVGVISQELDGKSDQLLVVATHGGTARCVLGHLLQLPLSHWGVIGGLSNASWSILERNPRQWNLIEHNAGSIPEPVYGEESGALTP